MNTEDTTIAVSIPGLEAEQPIATPSRKAVPNRRPIGRRKPAATKPANPIVRKTAHDYQMETIVTMGMVASQLLQARRGPANNMFQTLCPTCSNKVQSAVPVCQTCNNIGFVPTKTGLAFITFVNTFFGQDITKGVPTTVENIQPAKENV